MTGLDPAEIQDWHAHVYYDPADRAPAERLRQELAARFEAELGRWHDQPVGPHPVASYQVAFAKKEFAGIVPWLALNRGGLVIFIHPNTGDEMADHRDRAIWLGAKMELDLSIF